MGRQPYLRPGGPIVCGHRLNCAAVAMARNRRLPEDAKPPRIGVDREINTAKLA